MAVVRLVVPSAADLSANELENHLSPVLAKMADVMESANRSSVDELIENSPAQGLARFQQRYDVRELMTEDRLLRRIIIERVEMALGRRMSQAEHVTLDTSIDIMLQEAVVAFITQLNKQLSTAAETELKYLSFLSHDIRDDLGSVVLSLEVLRQRLASVKEFERNVEVLDAARRAIQDIVGGVGRLLQTERLSTGEI